MRVLLLSTVLVACAPRVGPEPVRPEPVEPGSLEADLGRAPAPAPAPAAAPAAVRAEAPAGPGVRSGTIARAKLVAVLDAGPGRFLRQIEVTPRLDGNRFVGWQLVQLLDHQGPLSGVDVAPGDVLLSINGKPLARPDDLQAVWDSLRTADHLEAELWRGDQKLTLRFAIEPRLGG